MYLCHKNASKENFWRRKIVETVIIFNKNKKEMQEEYHVNRCFWVRMLIFLIDCQIETQNLPISSWEAVFPNLLFTNSQISHFPEFTHGVRSIVVSFPGMTSPSKGQRNFLYWCWYEHLSRSHLRLPMGLCAKRGRQHKNTHVDIVTLSPLMAQSVFGWGCNVPHRYFNVRGWTRVCRSGFMNSLVNLLFWIFTRVFTENIAQKYFTQEMYKKHNLLSRWEQSRTVLSACRTLSVTLWLYPALCKCHKIRVRYWRLSARNAQYRAYLVKLVTFQWTHLLLFNLNTSFLGGAKRTQASRILTRFLYSSFSRYRQDEGLVSVG